MTIQDLSEEQRVKIEIVWADKTFSVDSKVAGKRSTDILLKPYIFNGNEIRVHEKVRDFTFNIFAIDPYTKHRVGWNDVEMKSVDFKGNHYYICRPKNYLLYAADQERRNNNRISINLPGSVTDIASGATYAARIVDLSANGIAFSLPSSREINKINVKVCLDDSIGDSEFNLELLARIVRIVPKGNEVLYGCELRSTPQELAMYTFLRQSEERRLL